MSDFNPKERNVSQLYRKSKGHTHENIDNRSEKVSDEVKRKIITLCEQKYTNATIQLMLRDDATIAKESQPTKHQIKNVVQVYKAQRDGRDPLTMTQLVEFVMKHMEIPEDPDTSFIARFERSPPHVAESKFRFFVTTTRLLRNSMKSRILHADATYKVTTDNLPLIVVGSSDEMGKFHFIGIEVTSSETAAAFACAFEAIRSGIFKITNREFQPEYIVCDAATAIRNGFRTVFGSRAIIIMYYSHVIGNVDRKYTFNDSKANKEAILNDLRCIHLSRNKDIFHRGCQLFVEKWIEKEKEVVTKLQASFFVRNPNWYIGAAIRVPKTNNTLERFNGLMKTHQTFHKRSPLKSFITDSLKIVAQRSKEYIMDKTAFATELTISEAQLREGCDASVKFVNEESVEDDGPTKFYVYSSESNDEPLTIEAIEQWKAEIYTTFEEYAQNHYKIWIVTFPNDLNEWQRAECTCQAFDDDYMCKHIISIAHQLDIVEKPTLNFDDEPLFKVNKRGRPKNASKQPLSKE